MVTYPYEWNILEWDETPKQTNKQTNKNLSLTNFLAKKINNAYSFKNLLFLPQVKITSINEFQETNIVFNLCKTLKQKSTSQFSNGW